MAESKNAENTLKIEARISFEKLCSENKFRNAEKIWFGLGKNKSLIALVCFTKYQSAINIINE